MTIARHGANRTRLLLLLLLLLWPGSSATVVVATIVGTTTRNLSLSRRDGADTESISGAEPLRSSEKRRRADDAPAPLRSSALGFVPCSSSLSLSLSRRSLLFLLFRGVSVKMPKSIASVNLSRLPPLPPPPPPLSVLSRDDSSILFFCRADEALPAVRAFDSDYQRAGTTERSY